MASWKELSGRSLRWGWLRSKRDGDSRATQMSECSLGSLSSTCLHRGSSIAEEPTSELSGARVPRRGIVSLSEERLERLVSEQGGWLPLTASQLVRTFPSPTRWWSSNNNPLVRARPLAPTTPRTTSRCKPSEHCLPHLPATDVVDDDAYRGLFPLFDFALLQVKGCAPARRHRGGRGRPFAKSSAARRAGA